MKLTIDRDRLAALVRAAAPAVAKSTTLPALKSFRVEAADETVRLSATDMELSITAAAPGCEVLRSGSCLVEADRLADIARLTPPGPIDFAADATCNLVRYRGGSYKLPVEPVDTFPHQPTPDGGRAANMPAGTLTTVLRRVAFAANRKERSERFTTTTVQLELAGNTLTASATDTFRIAVATGRLDAAGEPVTVLLPLKAVGAILSAFSDPGEPLTVTLWSAYAAFESARVSVRTALVSGRPPNWRNYESRIRPSGLTVSDDPRNLLRAVRSVTVTADAATADSGAMVVSCTGPTLGLSVVGRAGAGEIEHVCTRHEGRDDTVELRFQPDQWSEFLALAGSEGVDEVSLSLEEKKAALFAAGDDWRYMAMPQVER